MGKPKASAQTEFDVIEMIDKQADVNRVDQTNPYGSSEYTENADGTWSLENKLNPEMEEVKNRQLAMAKEGTMKDPFGALGDSETGRGIQGLMSSMFGKMKDRYMGEEGTSTSRHNNIGKGGGDEGAPPMAAGEAGQVSEGYRPPATSGMSTSTQVRELQEQEKLRKQKELMAAQAQAQAEAGAGAGM